MTNTYSEEELSHTLHKLLLYEDCSVDKMRHLLKAGASVLHRYELQLQDVNRDNDDDVTDTSGSDQFTNYRNVLQNAVAVKSPLEIVKYILEFSDVNTLRSLLIDTMEIAIETGQEDIATELIKCHLNCHAKVSLPKYKKIMSNPLNHVFGQFLIKAFGRNMLSVIDVFLNDERYNDLFKDGCLHEALKGVVVECDTDKARYLLAKMTNVKVALHLDDTNNNVPVLSLAIQRGNVDMVAMLVEEFGAELNISESVKDDYHTPLCEAAIRGNTDIVNILIKNGADVNGKGRKSTPLFLAVGKNHLEVAKILLSNGAATTMVNTAAEITYGSEEITILQKAARTKESTCLSYLLSSECPHRLDVNELACGELGTPLIRASAHVQVKNVQILLEHGADPNKLDYIRSSALICAMRHFDIDNFDGGMWGNGVIDAGNAVETVLLLLRYGADVNFLFHYCSPLDGSQHHVYPIDYAMSIHLVPLAHLLWEAGSRLANTEPKPGLCKAWYESILSTATVLSSKPWYDENKVPLFIRNVVNQPRNLCVLCRMTVRPTLRGNPRTAVKQLKLPDFLKDYLEFPDLDQFKEQLLTMMGTKA